MIDVVLATDVIGTITNSGYAEILDDDIRVTDQTLVETIFARVLSDSVAVTDGIATSFEYGMVLSDSVSVTDSVFDGIINVSVSDAAGVTDQTLVETIFAQDSVAVGDLTNTSLVYSVALSDTASLSDSSIAGIIESADPFDAVNIADAASTDIYYIRVLQDNLVVSDSAAPTTTREVSLSTDILAVSDSVAAEPTSGVLVSDVVSGITDSLAVTRFVDRSPADTIVILDQVFIGETRDVVIGTDSVLVSDFSLAEAINIDVVVTDTIFAVLDSIARETTILRVFNDTVSVTDAVSAARGGLVDRDLIDTITFGTDSVKQILWPGFDDDLDVFDIVQVEKIGTTLVAASADGFSITVPFQSEISYDHTGDLRNYLFRPLLGSRGVPFQIEGVTPVTTTLASGGSGTLISVNDPNFTTNLFQVGSATFNAGTDVGRYLAIGNGRVPGVYKIVGVPSSTRVQLDRPLQLADPANGTFSWVFTTAIQAITFRTTNKVTNQAGYTLSIQGLVTKAGVPFGLAADFITTGILGPKLLGVTLSDEGQLVVNYDQPMRTDRDIVLSSEYTVTGPSSVSVRQVQSVGPSTVALDLNGLSSGSYALTINIAGTPKDVAGNPLEPAFNQAVFTGSVPLTNRSIFTDKGPISKPALSLQTGTGVTFNSGAEATLTGSTLTPDLINEYLNFSGTLHNDGTYKITGVLSPTKLRVQASFVLPDSAGSPVWEIFDPRNGEIADDPTDVGVLVNGTPVTPVAVVGLLGQVVLPTAPEPNDDVKVNYSWMPNPTVDFRRLNSKEFRLNSWNADTLYGKSTSQHRYRYNNTLVRPSEYAPLDILATLDQPETRDLYYRAFERAYTATLNDPSSLLLNSPIHKIAFPSAQRTINEAFITYEAEVLPEAATPAWVKHGAGLTSTSAGLLTATDNTSGPYPVGQTLFWTQELDLTFPHAFALSWRFYGASVTAYNGVFSGLAVGYSDDAVAYAIGFIEVSGVKKIGFLKRGFADDASTVDSWIGGLDNLSVSTGLPVTFDWSVLHSYRLFRDRTGTISLYVDGDILATLRVTPDQVPFLEEVNAPFNELQGVFFGSISREAESVSVWDFVRYLLLPTNPLQTSPSSFVSYEGNILPEVASRPWTPIGFHGTESIVNSQLLLLDSTSASDGFTASEVGGIGGDYRGFVRLEPLLSSASEIVVDVAPQLRTYTYGVDPYGLTVAVDDGNRLMQLAFFPSAATPKFSYGGRSLPESFSPYVWSAMGGGSASMLGRVLRISDTTVGDGKVYFIDDLSPPVSDSRVVSSATDYIFEFRVQVVSYTTDGAGFAGVFGQVDDGSRALGLMFEVIAGTKYVTFNSEGVPLGSSARFAFNWNDGQPHTYRFVKSTGGDLVTLFIDAVFVGTVAYHLFTATGGTATVSFGSSSPLSAGALSQVDWHYCNVWRTRTDLKHYVGLWKGYDADSLTGYHLPLKTSGRGAQIVGNALGDSLASFIADGVTSGDTLVIDEGPNKGVYAIAAVSGATTLTIVGTWPLNPTLTSYRIVSEVDWTAQHKYRLIKDSSGLVSVLYENATDPIIQVGYNSIDLPASGTGLVQAVSNGIPSIVFGSFNSENLVQSSWDFVRYGISRSATEITAAPHHQFLNQRNVMESPERLTTLLSHTLTDFSSSSTGIVPKKAPEFLTNTNLPAYTRLNEGTPLVPSTQDYQVRSPTPVKEFVSALNMPQDVLNTASFTLNDGSVRYRLIVPEGVLYSALDVIEESSGEEALITPFGDEDGHSFSGFNYQKEVCLEYSANVLPENDIAAPTPWIRQSDNPGQVTASVAGGILTYSTTGSATVYKNNTTLPDAPGLQTEVKFRLKLLADATLGTGDTQVRFGLSAPGLTLALAFVTTPHAERYVMAVDLNNGNNLGSVSFDFLDGAYHTYRIVRDPGAGVVRVSIDS